MSLEQKWIELLPIHADGADSVFRDYENYVINGELPRYRSIIQYGKKEGESLEAHILNGVGVLESIRSHLQLTETETRVLYTSFTIHDINKVREGRSFSQTATPELLTEEIAQLGMEDFFPDWRTYLHDITTLVRAHPGHYSVSGESLIAKRDPVYGLGLKRVQALIHLMRAADIIGLSHTLHERDHKATFLSHLNTYLADSQIDEQYVFHTHQLVEQRGLLTNVIHNALMQALQEDAGWLPLLLYADGVAYLGRKGVPFTSDGDVLNRLAGRVKTHLSEIVLGKPAELLEQTSQGIKFKPDALISGHRFEVLLQHVGTLVSRRKFRVEDLEAKARERAAVPKGLQHDTSLVRALHVRLDDPSPLINASLAQMRAAELARTYYIFLSDHFKSLDDKWLRIYRLLDLSEDQFAFYACFEARYDRCYILAGDIALTLEEAFDRLAQDGQSLLDQRIESNDSTGEQSDADIQWLKYLELYLNLDGRPVTQGEWADHLVTYVAHQHEQCVHCGSPFEVVSWRKADVRQSIDVQKFSNRLEGGGNAEPVRNICTVCRIQFMLEAINYPEVRGENTFFLHLTPRSFLTLPYVRGLMETFTHLRGSDVVVHALNMDVNTAIEQVTDQHPLRPRFRDRTKEGKAQPYGIYIPQYMETVAGVINFPINAPGDNDTERYLFALWNAVVLQRTLPVKALLSQDPVPPLTPDAMPDVFLDLVPLSCIGLLPINAYTGSSLDDLWDRIRHLFALKRLFREDYTPEMVRAMTEGPLHLFHTLDRLIAKQDQSRLVGRAFADVKALATSTGGSWMAQLSELLQQLAALAWKGGLRGKSWERSSLLYPVSEVLTQMAKLGGERDTDLLKAATAQYIFDHLERIKERMNARATKEASRQFVDLWYNEILGGVYGGSVQKLLRDEKLLRSAYYFYIQNQIPVKAKESEE